MTWTIFTSDSLKIHVTSANAFNTNRRTEKKERKNKIKMKRKIKQQTTYQFEFSMLTDRFGYEKKNVNTLQRNILVFFTSTHIHTSMSTHAISEKYKYVVSVHTYSTAHQWSYDAHTSRQTTTQIQIFWVLKSVQAAPNIVHRHNNINYSETKTTLHAYAVSMRIRW